MLRTELLRRFLHGAPQQLLRLFEVALLLRTDALVKEKVRADLVIISTYSDMGQPTFSTKIRCYVSFMPSPARLGITSSPTRTHTTRPLLQFFHRAFDGFYSLRETALLEPQPSFEGQNRLSNLFDV